MSEQFLQSIKRSSRKNLAGGWALLLLGIFLSSIAALDSVPKLRAYGWVEGSGRVAATDIYQRTGRSHAWCGRVTYTYIVDGKTYKSRNQSSALISDIGCNIQKTHVMTRLASVHVGAVIRIFYDAETPQRVAIWREGLKWHDFFFWVLAILPISVGTYSILQARCIRRATHGRL